MIRVISIGTDRKVFDEKSAVRERLLKQRELFSELHVVVFAPRSAGLVAEQIGDLWLYPTNSISRWLYVIDAIKLVRGLIAQRAMNPKDSVVTAQDPFECGLAAFFAARRSGLPLHLQIHTDFLNPYFSSLSALNRIRVSVAGFLLPRARGVRVVSKRIVESLHKEGITLLREATVLPVFSEHAQKWATKPLRRFKKENSELCFALMVSRLAPEKDFPTALKALRFALDGGSAVALVIVGEGSEESKIRNEIRTLRLSGVVRMELWQSDLSSFYRVSDIILFTSRFEGYGLVLLEAAVHAKPIITTDVGIARELVPEEYRRFICPIGDVECLGGRISELAGDPKLRRAYGAALRTSAKKLFIDEAEYWKRYQKQLEECVSTR